MDWNWSLFFQGIIALAAFAGVIFAFLKYIHWFLNPISKKVDSIHLFLASRFSDYFKLVISKSQKRMTEKGLEIIKKHNIDSFLEKECDLLKDNTLKEKTAPQIFMQAWEWTGKGKGKEKVFEIILNSNNTEKEIKEFLALAILNKIKPNNTEN